MATPRYKQYVDTLAARIRNGELAAGTQLPTHRAFAAQEGLSLVTASRVYQELINQGLVSGETGRGNICQRYQFITGYRY
ncbi:HTH-type transcriptional repressor yvoA [Morganella morganii]|nr:HTH-type transcriptional repressor yvoA [Morganella morganii]